MVNERPSNSLSVMRYLFVVVVVFRLLLNRMQCALCARNIRSNADSFCTVLPFHWWAHSLVKARTSTWKNEKWVYSKHGECIFLIQTPLTNSNLLYKHISLSLTKAGRLAEKRAKPSVASWQLCGQRYEAQEWDKTPFALARGLITGLIAAQLSSFQPNAENAQVNRKEWQCARFLWPLRRNNDQIISMNIIFYTLWATAMCCRGAFSGQSSEPRARYAYGWVECLRFMFVSSKYAHLIE